MRRAKAMVVLSIVVGCALTGCSMNRWVEVESGTYVTLRSTGSAVQAGPRALQEVKIDRDQQTATFGLADGSEIVTSFVPRVRAEWPSGCPANLGSTRMEVLDIEKERLIVGTVAFSDPILVRDCPRAPFRLVLRENGAIGGGGGACVDQDGCIFFRPSKPTASLSDPMKGYELYSWYVEEESEWCYTLTPGTNRLKTLEELTSQENVGIEEGWIKMTVLGARDLEGLLDQLPSEAHVLWRGSRALEQMGMQESDVALPPGDVVEEIEAYCENMGVQLEVIR